MTPRGPLSAIASAGVGGLFVFLVALTLWQAIS